MHLTQTSYTLPATRRTGLVLRALLSIGMLTAATACARDTLRPLPSPMLESLRSRGKVGEIQIALEPYTSDAKTMSILDKKLISEGLLPVLVVLRNDGESVYELDPYEIYLVDPVGNARAAGTVGGVARAAGKSELGLQSREVMTGVGNVPAVGLPFVPWLIADRVAQEHNKQLAGEYLGMGLPYYLPQGETRGLIFFEIPKGKAITLDGYRMSFRKIGPRGSAEHLQIEIPFVRTPGD